jgi:hypothetical protein
MHVAFVNNKIVRSQNAGGAHERRHEGYRKKRYGESEQVVLMIHSVTAIDAPMKRGPNSNLERERRESPG